MLAKKNFLFCHGLDCTHLPAQYGRLEANKTKTNKAKTISYISNERPNLGVCLLMKKSFIV